MKKLLTVLITILISISLIACSSDDTEVDEVMETNKPPVVIMPKETATPTPSATPEPTEEPIETEEPKETKKPLATVAPTPRASEIQNSPPVESAEVTEIPTSEESPTAEASASPTPSETPPLVETTPIPEASPTPNGEFDIVGRWVFEENPDLASYVLSEDGSAFAKESVGAVYARGTYTWGGYFGEMDLGEYGIVKMERVNDVLYLINPSDGKAHRAIKDE